MDQGHPPELANSLPATATSLTDVTVPQSFDKTPGASFDILSHNPSEEFDQFKLDEEHKNPVDLNLQINQELQLLVNENKTAQRKLEGYGKLEKMYQETKEKLDQFNPTENPQSMDNNIHVPSPTNKERKNLVSEVISLCDTMCSSLADPQHIDMEQLRQSILTFTQQMMHREHQYTQQKKINANLHSEKEYWRQQLQKHIIEEEKQTLESKQQMLSLVPKESIGTQTDIPDAIEKTSLRTTDDHSTHQIANPLVDDKITEFQQLQQKYRKVKDQNKELGKANNEWDKHCQKVQEHLNKQITSLRQELDKSEDIIKSQTDKQQELQQYTEQLKKQTDDKVTKSEEQSTKAIDFAKAQAQKVDELKKKLKMGQIKTEEQDSHVQQLQSISEIQKDEIDKLNTDVKRLKDAISRHDSSNRSQASLDLTLDNRNPHRNEQGSVGKLKNEIMVLQQQVTIYKDDFESERCDRERAQSELSALRTKYGQLHEEYKAVYEESKVKNREIEALRAARDQDRARLQKRDEETEQLKSTVHHMVSEQSRLQGTIDRLQREADYHQPPPYEYVSRQPSEVTGHSLQQQHIAENTVSDWSCPTCTFNNSGHKQECDMCGTRASSRHHNSSEDILPTYPGYASGYHGEAVIDRTEQCDDDIEWVRPA